MNALRSLAGELAGLFVEDKLFALAIALWLALALAALAARVVPAAAGGGALFAGLALILIASVVRASRARSRS